MCRLAKLLQPKFILIENVPNLLLMRKGMFRRQILDALDAVGYDNVAIRLLDASPFGVPQKRVRVFFLATRSKTFSSSLERAFETAIRDLKTHPRTVWEALSDLPADVAPDTNTPLKYPKVRKPSEFQREMRLDLDGACYTAKEKVAQLRIHALQDQLFNHHTKEIQEKRRALIALLGQGKKTDSLPKERLG